MFFSLLLTFVWGFSKECEIIFLFIYVFLLLHDTIVRYFCQVLQFTSILMKTNAKTRPFLLLVFSQLFVSLIALHLHYLYPWIKQFILFLRCVPFLLHLWLLFLLLHMFNSVFHDSSLENRLETICLNLVFETFLQIFSVFLFKKFEIAL